MFGISSLLNRQRKQKRYKSRALGLLSVIFSSDYVPLFDQTKRPTMKIYRIRTLALETFKTLNSLNLEFTKRLLIKGSNLLRGKMT